MIKIKREKTNRKIKAIALSQIFSLLIEIFAISFIFAMSLGVVSAEADAGGNIIIPTDTLSATPTESGNLGSFVNTETNSASDTPTDDTKISTSENTNYVEKNTESLNSDADPQTDDSKKTPPNVIGGNLMKDVGWFQALGWAGTVVALTSTLGAFLGEEKGKNVQTLGFAVGAGIMISKISYEALSRLSLTKDGVHVPFTKATSISPSALSMGVGVLAMYLIFANNYKDTKTKEVSIEFKCYAWQAPRGGSDCNKCNEDKLRPCSEYRCRALGQTCKIINEGTANAKCIDSSPGRVTSPGIKPWKEILTLGYKYTDVQERPPGAKTPGHMQIVDAQTGGCLRAFTPFTFGILTTNKNSDGTTIEAPAQCKIDYNHTAKFEDMGYFMGEQNLYIENHSQSISLPGTDAINSSFPGVVNDGEYTLYIRCMDGNGNTNEDEFAVRFCIDKSPDVTPPVIKATLPNTGAPVLYKVDNLTASVYTNEPSACRWSRKDASYSNMENQMTCSNNLWEMNAELLYTCTTQLTGIKDKEQNDFYFRCQDLSVRSNTMQESYRYSLMGTQPLTILSVAPNGTIGSGTSTAIITLQVQTDNGYKSGESTCYYSQTSLDKDYIQMAETGTNTHKQNLDLTNGNYKYYFKCVDAGGNSVFNSTEFTVFVDKFAPSIVRTYNWEGKLVIINDEESACSYSTTSCNFDISKSEGINMPYDFDASKGHIAEWKTDQNYFIKCVDRYNNQPDPSECSIIVRPYQMPTE